MRHIKKLTAVVLVLAALLALAPGASALWEVSTFPDITDPTVGEAVESLRIMGVLNGREEGFVPLGELTRAEFCKIAVLTMGKAADVPAYETRTIFPDVSSTHWARGYVNLAVNTVVDESRLILGVANGYFEPDRSITYGETVTILLRVLGYGAEANLNWPQGAMEQSKAIGLDRDISAHSANDTINRGEAAIMFRNMLLTRPKGSDSIYAAKLGTVAERSVIVACDMNGIRLSTSPEPVKPALLPPAQFFVGKRGTAVLNSRGELLTFLPGPGSNGRTVTVEKASRYELIATDGTRYMIPASTPVMRDHKESAWSECFEGLDRKGVTLTVYLASDGSVEYIYVENMTTIQGVTAIATGSGRDGFGGALPTVGVKIVKNGADATADDIRAGDVGLFDRGKNTLYISDFRISAVYEGATPNPMAPSTVKLFGQDFQVSETALESIAATRVGTRVLALFGPDGRVAALNPAGFYGSNAMGIVTDGTGSSVTVRLLNAPVGIETISGTLAGDLDASYYRGSVVYVSQGLYGDGPYLSLTRTMSSARGSINVAARTMGTTPLAESLAVYETLGGYVNRIALEDAAMDTIPSYSVEYAHLNTSGEVDVLVLNDVTGDMYTYGLVTTRVEPIAYERDEDGNIVYEELPDDTETEPGEDKTGTEEPGDSAEGGDTEAKGEPKYVYGVIATIIYGNGASDRLELALTNGYIGSFGGAAPSLMTTEVGDYTLAAGSLRLNALRGLTGNQFDADRERLYTGSAVLPIADKVLCYDPHTGAWYDDPGAFLLYFTSYTAYYDRSPGSGGKVRIIVAE